MVITRGAARMNSNSHQEDNVPNKTREAVKREIKKKRITILIFIGIIILLIVGLIILITEFCCDDPETNYTRYGEKKPVIYLYPTEKTDVSVNLKLDGKLTCTYPVLNKGWNVTAYPDGKVINKSDGKEYSYLYWEGESNTKYDMSKGFVVKGEDTAEFLQEKLSYMGLTPREYNEFIVYWLPQMQNNKYNLITFQGKAYTDSAKLDISPKPDSMLRVFMAYKPLKNPVDIQEQKLKTFERRGFTVIEWGGCEIK